MGSTGLPGAILTLLAPAHRCNQHCPRCILDLTGEPVRRFDLEPADYARFVTQFVAAGVPVRSVAFQGYEVTLPSSWPYVDAVFRVAKEHGLRRCFITNGMLLQKRIDEIQELEPTRITVSLDGAHAPVNDRIRGLVGAFEATLHSVRTLLRRVPNIADRIAIASTLYDEENFRSLLEMASVLGSLGLSRWALSFEYTVVDGRERPVATREVLERWLGALAEASDRFGIRFHVNDEFGFFASDEDDGVIQARHLFDPAFLYRLDPAGYVRAGPELVEVWDAVKARRWDPSTDNAVETVGYWETVATALAGTPVRQSPGSGHPNRMKF